jgi:hypothetical protein
MDPEPTVGTAAEPQPEPEPEPAAAPPAEGDSRERSSGFGVALLLGAAAMVAAIITARASVIGGQATDLWQRSVREEERRGALLTLGVRYAYGEEGDVAFMIATSQTRASALEEAAASAPPDVAAPLAAEARVHAQVADAMRTSTAIANDPRFMRPSGAYDLQASLADERAESGDDQADDPLVSIAAADAASAQTIRILAVAIIVGIVFLLGSLAQAVASRRRALLVAGWVTLGTATVLALVFEVTA